MFAIIVYVLCTGTSALCSVLLFRGYAKSRARLLLWSGICFAGLTVNNALLVVDVRIVPMIDLSLWRTLPALVGVFALVYGLIWETR